MARVSNHAQHNLIFKTARAPPQDEDIVLRLTGFEPAAIRDLRPDDVSEPDITLSLPALQLHPAADGGGGAGVDADARQQRRDPRFFRLLAHAMMFS